MQVGHGLAGVSAVVDDQSKTVRELQFPGDLSGDQQQVAEDGLIVGARLADSGNHLLRNDQQVHGRLRLNVVQDDAVLVLMLDSRGDVAVDDFLEDRFDHGMEESGVGWIQKP